MNTQNTPGPWAISPQKGHNGDIATVYNTTEGWVSIHAPSWVNIGDQKVAMANARLISAAPDLLEALQSYSLPIDLENIALSCIEFGSEAVNRELRRRAAIAKAEGGAT